MNASITADPGRRRLIAAAAAALRLHPSSDIDATDAAVLARRVDASADAIAANTRGEVPVSGRQRAAALALALDMLITASRAGTYLRPAPSCRCVDPPAPKAPGSARAIARPVNRHCMREEACGRSVRL